MGQSTYGILYGAKFTREHEDVADRLYDLIVGWGSSAGIEFEPSVCGFWLAVGASGMDGVPFLETIDLESVRYSDLYTLAEAEWPRLVEAAMLLGVVVGEPCLWIVETEVA